MDAQTMAALLDLAVYEGFFVLLLLCDAVFRYTLRVPL
jgi:hypothetical protein